MINASCMSIFLNISTNHKNNYRFNSLCYSIDDVMAALISFSYALRYVCMENRSMDKLNFSVPSKDSFLKHIYTTNT